MFRLMFVKEIYMYIYEIYEIYTQNIYKNIITKDKIINKI